MVSAVRRDRQPLVLVVRRRTVARNRAPAITRREGLGRMGRIGRIGLYATHATGAAYGTRSQGRMGRAAL